MSRVAHPSSRRRALQALLCGALALPADAAQAAAGGDKRFEAALRSFQSGRFSEAFGRFFALAQDGDADAARIVLFMHHYGPVLWGSYWDLATFLAEEFQELAMSPKARKAPPFQPPWQRIAPKGR